MGLFTSSKVKKLEHDIEILACELIRIKAKLISSEYDTAKLYKAASYLDKHNDQLIAENKRLKRSGSGLTQAQIRAAIRFCHPDKHNNSKAATELTVTLLELRK